MLKAAVTHTTPTRRSRRGASPAIAAGLGVDLVEAPGFEPGMRSAPVSAMTLAPGLHLPKSATVYFKLQTNRKPPTNLDGHVCVVLTTAGNLHLTALSSQPDGTYLEHGDGTEAPHVAPRYEAVWPAAFTESCDARTGA